MRLTSSPAVSKPLQSQSLFCLFLLIWGSPLSATLSSNHTVSLSYKISMTLPSPQSPEQFLVVFYFYALSKSLQCLGLGFFSLLNYQLPYTEEGKDIIFDLCVHRGQLTECYSAYPECRSSHLTFNSFSLAWVSSLQCPSDSDT